MQDINTVFNNPNNIYYGHGTSVDSREITDSIIQNGLRCSHGSLYFTSVPLGMGLNIEDSEIQLLRNWPHNNSKIIIIISLPMKFIILDSIGLGTYNMADSAFYYVPDDNKQREYNLTNSPYVLPEFVWGYFDALDDTFIENPNYYEKLPIEDQEKLFMKVKNNYYNVIEEGCGIDHYRDIMDDLGYEFPLSEEEVTFYKQISDANKILDSLKTVLDNRELKLPDGTIIPAEKYVKTCVLPYIPLSGYIILKNGNKLPIFHFIAECVLFDCQDRYNGDFLKYLNENVDMEKTSQLANDEGSISRT